MALPRWLARANRGGFNRLSRHVVGHVPGFGLVHHVGRRSGTAYATPVNAFRRPGGFAVPMTYGPESEWARNVLAAGAAVITNRGRDVAVTAPRLVQSSAREWAPAPVRVILRALSVDWFLLVDTAPPTIAGN